MRAAAAPEGSGARTRRLLRALGQPSFRCRSLRARKRRGERCARWRQAGEGGCTAGMCGDRGGAGVRMRGFVCARAYGCELLLHASAARDGPPNSAPLPPPQHVFVTNSNSPRRTKKVWGKRNACSSVAHLPFPAVGLGRGARRPPCCACWQLRQPSLCTPSHYLPLPPTTCPVPPLHWCARTSHQPGAAAYSTALRGACTRAPIATSAVTLHLAAPRVPSPTCTAICLLALVSFFLVCPRPCDDARPTQVGFTCKLCNARNEASINPRSFLKGTLVCKVRWRWQW